MDTLPEPGPATRNASMGDDLLPILTRFHQEVLLPDMKRVVAETTNPRFDDINRHFDEIYRRFDRLETIHQ
jgi:hypothetical protein